MSVAMKVLGACGAAGGAAGLSLYIFGGSEELSLHDRRLLVPPRDYSDTSKYPSKYTFVIDMDETLLHTSFTSETTGKVNVRTYAAELLKTTAALGEMILWTAGTEPYAKLALPLIGPEADLFHHCIYRNELWWGPMTGSTKGLERLERNLDYTLLVDNSEDVVVEADRNNAIVVTDFFKDKNDAELEDVAKIIKDLHASGEKVPVFLEKMVKDGRLQRLASGRIHTYPKSRRRSFLGLW